MALIPNAMADSRLLFDSCSARSHCIPYEEDGIMKSCSLVPVKNLLILSISWRSGISSWEDLRFGSSFSYQPGPNHKLKEFFAFAFC